MITAEKSHAETDRRLAEMEDHLRGIYSRASRELDEKVLRYFAKFEEQDKRKAAQVAAGKLDPEEYADWRKNKLLYGEQYKKFQESVTGQLAHVNETALAYLNGEMPEVYTLNYNDMGTTISDAIPAGVRVGTAFELTDAETVRILATEDVTLLPKKKLDVAKDKRWNHKKMQSEILQGILQGESIPQMEKRLRGVTDMNRNSAIRNARTMVTSAENRGRLESMRRCRNSLGIVTRKRWISSDQPGRTRDWHLPGAFDRLTVDEDEPFVNELGEILYPGDPSAAPANVYNCRCSLGAEIVGFIDPETGELNAI